MGVEWERFRLPADLIGDLTPKPEPPRPRLGETFLRGPIPWGWLAEASRLPGSGFSVAMAVWYVVHRFRRDPRASVAELAECLGTGRTTIKAGLRGAESAGLISVRRDPGRKPVYTLP